MIRFKLGKSKRLVALLCALLLTLEMVAFPLTQAKAAATAALATVGFGVTTAAFLSACGIYPYWSSADVSETFSWGDWEAEDLAALLQEYNAANAASPIASQQIRAFLQGATLVVGSAVWEKLRVFAEWVKTKYSVADNQTGVELGKSTVSLPVLPSLPAGQSASSYFSSGGGLDVGRYVSVNRRLKAVTYTGDSAEIIYLRAYMYDNRYGGVWSAVFASLTQFGVWFVYDNGGAASVTSSSVSSASSWSQIIVPGANVGGGLLRASFVSGVPVCNSLDELNTLYTQPLPDSFSGITADTTTVSIPDALPDGTEYGGLRVSGLPAATMAETVTDAVQDSVGERLKTPVKVVEVELAPGTEVDSETGTITQNPVVVEAPAEETIPALSALVPAQEFIQTMTTALQTKFPFCLPFDFMRLINAVAKSPEAPVITMTFFDRIGGGHYTITVDLSPWDDIAAIVRRLEAMILFLGFWTNFDKFNMLNVLLGQIG